MSRRNISPARGRLPGSQSVPDERELIIKKLKDDLILARGKEKEVIILEKHLAELSEKNQIISEQNLRRESEGRAKNESSQKMISDLKRQVDLLKAQLKDNNVELGQKEADHLQLKKHLAKRTNQIEKVRKQGIHIKNQNQNLLVDHADLLSRFEDADADLRRIEATNHNYDTRISNVNGKIAEVKAYIGQLKDQSQILKQKLRKYEQENNSISDDLNNKQDNIDQLEQMFAEEHQIIKEQVDGYIELEHRNQRTLTEIRHNTNMVKSENQKSMQLNGYLQKVEKAISAVRRDQQAVNDQIKQYEEHNRNFEKDNTQLGSDLTKCQEHLQNLMRQNSMIQEHLERCLREDEQVMATLRRKRTLPSSSDLVQMRESRKNTDRTYV